MALGQPMITCPRTNYFTYSANPEGATQCKHRYCPSWPTVETASRCNRGLGGLQCESCCTRQQPLAYAYSPQARPKHNAPAAADIMAMVRRIMAMRRFPRSPYTTVMRLSPRTTGMRVLPIPHTGIRPTTGITGMVATMGVAGTDMVPQQSACALDFMVTAPELVWAASATDIEQLALAVSDGPAATAIVQSVWVALGLGDAGSVVRGAFTLNAQVGPGFSPVEPELYQSISPAAGR